MPSGELPPPPPLLPIPARSYRQAMDWSLVLASQGIEAIIDRSPTTAIWVLWVEPQDHVRALTAIRLYRRENRHWAWLRKLNESGEIFHWGVLIWCWVLCMIQWLSVATGGMLDARGVMNNHVPATGQWWRLVTAITLHADIGHLAANVSSGFIILGFAMARFGWGTTLLASLLAGIVGNVASLTFHPEEYIGLGASGMIMGGLGLLAAHGFWLLRHGRAAIRPMLASVGGAIGLFVLLGFNPNSDVVAHSGGFVAGGILGALLALRPERWQHHRGFDSLAGVLAVLLVGASWTWALLAPAPKVPLYLP